MLGAFVFVCVCACVCVCVCVCLHAQPCVIPTLILGLSDRLIYVWLRVWGIGKKGPVSAACREGVEIRASCHWQPSCRLWEIRSDVMIVKKKHKIKLIWKKTSPLRPRKGWEKRRRWQFQVCGFVCAIRDISQFLGCTATFGYFRSQTTRRVLTNPTPSSVKTRTYFKKFM